MKILIASDKFKGSLTAAEACLAIEKGLAGPGRSTSCIPVADGGDGMAKALNSALKGEWKTETVIGPLGSPVEAGYALVNEGSTAVIEMAEASGLALPGEGVQKDPWKATTFGTGQLMAAAIRLGVSEILLGIGGSATNDGGTGMAEALGFQFLDERGEPLNSIPGNLDEVTEIRPPAGLDQFPKITVACDVVNPLRGNNGCTRIYGPQKGIATEDFERHEARLDHLVSLIGERGESAAVIPGAGAAGGMGFGCLVFLNGKLVPGFDLVAEVLDLEKQVAAADIIVTGEGKIDAQSLEGKAPAGVAQLGRRYGKPVFGFCGLRGEGDLDGIFDGIFEIEKGSRTVEESMRDGAVLLEQTAAKHATALSSNA